MDIVATESEPAVPPTKSAADEMSEKAKEQLTKLAKEMGMPVWALYCIGICKSNIFAFFYHYRTCVAVASSLIFSLYPLSEKEKNQKKNYNISYRKKIKYSKRKKK